MQNNIMTPAGFALILICFLFTFCTVQCGDDTVMKIQGIDLALGTQPEMDGMLANLDEFGDELDMDGEDLESEIDIYALIAFIAAAAGLLFFFLLGGRSYAAIAALAGFTAFVCLLILRFTLGDDIESEAAEMVSLEFQLPYWIAMLVALINGLSNTGRLQR